LQVATAPPQHHTPGRSVCAQVPCPVGSIDVGQENALPGATQSWSKNVSRSHVAGPASGFGFSAHASASVMLHVRHEPTAEPGHFTQRSDGPQLSSLWQPGLHSAANGFASVTQYVPAEHVTGAWAGNPGGASAWHWDLPVREVTVHEATSEVPGVSLPPVVVLEQAATEARTKETVAMVRLMPPRRRRPSVVANHFAQVDGSLYCNRHLPAEEA
jgi:hypothetical protein